MMMMMMMMMMMIQYEIWIDAWVRFESLASLLLAW